jgi:hypothetical protein
MANLSTYYPAPITAADLGLGAGSNATFGSLTANNGTLTASAPVLDLAQTWNNAAVTFTGARIDITNTASGTGSRFLDCMVGGASAIRLARIGSTPYALFGTADNGIGAISTSQPALIANGGVAFVVNSGSGGAYIRSDSPYAWASGTNLTGATTDLFLRRDAANTLAQYNGTAAQTFRIYNTFTSATNFERLNIIAQAAGSVIIGTEKGSGGGSARSLEFQTDGVTRLTLATNGAATFSAGVTCAGISSIGGGISTNQSFTLSSNFSMSSQVLTATLDCTSNPAGIRLYGLGNTGGSATNTERLHISTRTGNSYFISTQATGTGTARALEIRTADVARLTFEAAGGLTIADANNIAVGTTTGTRIGTGTTQLLGFWNATPAAQPAAVADATDAASTQARLNDLLARLRTIGIIAA